MHVYYCANCRRDRLRKRLTIGDRARVCLRRCLYGVLNHPIVSVPNQPEIPAFVASVFIRRTMGDASCDRKRRRGPSRFRRNYPRWDNTIRCLAASSGRLDCHENIQISEKRERERGKGREGTGQSLEFLCLQLISDWRLKNIGHLGLLCKSLKLFISLLDFHSRYWFIVRIMK